MNFSPTAVLRQNRTAKEMGGKTHSFLFITEREKQPFDLQNIEK